MNKLQAHFDRLAQQQPYFKMLFFLLSALGLVIALMPANVIDLHSTFNDKFMHAVAFFGSP
jgi:hypothetical protein